MKIWRPYTPEFAAPPALKVSSARGAFLFLSNGQKVLDGISSWWLVTFGHAQAETVEALRDQSPRLAQAVFANFSHEPAERLTDSLGKLLPTKFSRAFFSDNGSTAVEVAMKMALQATRLRGHSRRRKFLAFSRAYHGDTAGAMSLSARGPFTAHFRDLLFEIVRCEQGLLLNDPLDTWLSDFHRVLESESSDDLCAVILEPLVQGAGGMIIWPPSVVETVCRAARERGLLVIFDEVMTGFGRTGSTFAFENLPADCLPDFLCLSKGLTGGFLPMGLTLTTEEIFSSFQTSHETLYHGHSYTGNALSCAAAAANLELWLTRPPQNDLLRIEKAQRRALQRAANQGLAVRETRVCGTIGVLELEPEIVRPYRGWSQLLAERCLREGVFIRPLGSTVYLMPPYCSTDREIENAWDVIFHHLARALEISRPGAASCALS